MSFHNIQAIELLWTAIAVIGFVFAVYNFTSATRLVRRIKSIVPRPDKSAWRTARGVQTSELFRLIMQTIYIMIGIASFYLPPGSSSEVPLRFQVSAFLIRWGLVATATLTAMQSVNAFRLRRYFIKRDREDE